MDDEEEPKIDRERKRESEVATNILSQKKKVIVKKLDYTYILFE